MQLNISIVVYFKADIFLKQNTLFLDVYHSIITKNDCQFQTIASVLSALKFAFIICTLMQFDPTSMLGLAETPPILVWAWENKGYACMMAFFIGKL